MKKENSKNAVVAVCMIFTFILWTAAIQLFDVKAIGPDESQVGLATLNGAFHNFTGVHMSLYSVTDILGIIPLLIVLCFGVLGLFQWVKRKSIKCVDYSIIVLGIFYVVVMAVYIFFEVYVVNYRPILIEGRLEASYPSSTTTLAMCVMPTALMQLNRRIKNTSLRRTVCFFVVLFTVFMVIGRLISGVHWLSDIIGGAFLSFGLVFMYRYFVNNR